MVAYPQVYPTYSSEQTNKAYIQESIHSTDFKKKKAKHLILLQEHHSIKGELFIFSWWYKNQKSIGQAIIGWRI